MYPVPGPGSARPPATAKRVRGTERALHVLLGQPEGHGGVEVWPRITGVGLAREAQAQQAQQEFHNMAINVAVLLGGSSMLLRGGRETEQKTPGRLFFG